MASPLCNTGLYANDVLCEVIANLDNLIETAEQVKSDAEAAIADLETSVDEAIADIKDIDYSADITGVSLSISAPSDPVEPDYSAEKPTNPSLPSVGSALIDASTIDDRFNDAISKLSRVETKRERDAEYRASSMGLGMSSSALTIALRRAEEEANKEIVNAALQENIKYADWLREDTKFIYELLQEDYKNRSEAVRVIHAAEAATLDARVEVFKAKITLEAEKRGYAETEINAILTQADNATKYALEKVKLLSTLSADISKTVADLTTGLAQAIYSAAHYSLGGSGSQSVSESISS